MKKNNSILFIVFSAIIVLMVAATAAAGAMLAMANQERIAYGTTLEGIALNSLTRKEAKTLIEETSQEKILASTINLTFQQKTWQIRPEEINLSVNSQSILEAAYATGHTGSFLNRLADNIRCAINGNRLELRATFDDSVLEDRLQAIAQEIAQNPASATCYIDSKGQVIHTPAKKGIKLDTIKLYDQIAEKLQRLELKRIIEIEPEVTLPAILDEDVAPINSIIGSYTTHFYPGDTNRNQNIRIASMALNQVIVQPGQVLSFNDTVGHRDAASGYQNAPVIIEGQIKDDVGGGVCQVSSTLYNAILLAGMTPVERTSHFYPSSYVPAGRDATVADWVVDFKFRNPYKHCICILTSCYSDSVNVYILGCQEDLEGKTFSLETEIKSSTPPPVVTLYRHTYQNGTLINTEKLHTDQYDVPQNNDNSND